ncbi:MAG: ABC transporter permease, partial [Anaerolineae bacterium]
VEVLPPLLQSLSALLPVTYSLRAMRLAVLQGASLYTLRMDVLMLGAFSALLLPLSVAAFRAALRRVRRDGTLVGY